MCGEHLPLSLITMATWGSSPHVRGARLAGDLPVDCRGIIPACAGSTYPEDDEAGFQRDHPRMCGEHIRVSSRALSSLGSSPHVRGALQSWHGHLRRQGIIPACAGSTPILARSSAPSRDHPRMCGEHVLKVWPGALDSGSSPHVRGAPQGNLFQGHSGGIIPACAGSTNGNVARILFFRDHPRMCGEHSMLIVELFDA